MRLNFLHWNNTAGVGDNGDDNNDDNGDADDYFWFILLLLIWFQIIGFNY